MNKIELMDKFLKNCRRTPNFNWENLLTKKYSELLDEDDTVMKDILVYAEQINNAVSYPESVISNVTQNLKKKNYIK